jgi:bis(5'-nucleosyl)-tetraphosphatase (symmetrical)
VRRIFIGDIQGCREELEELLVAVRFDATTDELHPVGDMVNRGPDSLGVLRLLRAAGAGGVLGNHDVHLLRAARGLRKNGKRDTFGDVLAAPEREELLSWLAGRPFVRRWDDVWLVHAALHPAWADPAAELAGLDPLVSDPRIDFATRARATTRDGQLSPLDPPEPGGRFRPWFEHWFDSRVGDPRTVVYGHWARLNLVLRPKLRGLDTGCVWGGFLSAWIAEEDRIVQVAARRAWASFDD